MTPILLTWNLPAKKAAKARMLAMRSGVRVAAVETWQYLQPLPEHSAVAAAGHE